MGIQLHTLADNAEKQLKAMLAELKTLKELSGIAQSLDRIQLV